MTTTVVSKEKIPMGIILVGVALVVIGLIAGAMMNGSGTNAVNVLPDGGNGLVPGTSDDDTKSSSVLPKDPKVFDKAYTQYLLDQVMYSVRNNPESLEDMTDLITMRIKGREELVWSPEKVTLVKGKGVKDDNQIYFGLDGKNNEFYSGPAIIWSQKDPNSIVEVEAVMITLIGGRYQSYGEEPYKYGVEKYSDPPPEVLKVFSDKGVTLHY